MTWIKTIPFADADDRLRTLMSEVRKLYPIEYSEGVPAAGDGDNEAEGVVASHTLIPEAMFTSSRGSV